jgi:hypothetical protein
MRDGVVFYRSFRDAIKRLSPEDQLEAYDAIFDYAFDEIEATEGIGSAIMLMAKPQIDANNARYENGKKGAEYGIKGGRPRKENPTETPNKPQENPTETPKEKDKEKDKDINICAEEPHDIQQEEERLQNNFNILYALYPKKKGRTNAYLHYKQWVSKNGKMVGNMRYHLSNEQLYKAIKRYVQQQEDSGTELQYYKNFDTLLGRQILDYVEGI